MEQFVVSGPARHAATPGTCAESACPADRCGAIDVCLRIGFDEAHREFARAPAAGIQARGLGGIAHVVRHDRDAFDFFGLRQSIERETQGASAREHGLGQIARHTEVRLPRVGGDDRPDALLAGASLGIGIDSRVFARDLVGLAVVRTDRGIHHLAQKLGRVTKPADVLRITLDLRLLLLQRRVVGQVNLPIRLGAFECARLVEVLHERVGRLVRVDLVAVGVDLLDELVDAGLVFVVLCHLQHRAVGLAAELAHLPHIGPHVAELSLVFRAIRCRRCLCTARAPRRAS